MIPRQKQTALLAALAGEFDRVLKNGHHAEAEEIDLNDAKVLAIVLVPLRDDAAGHRGVFQRHNRTERALADDHAAGMLAEMARQPIHGCVKRNECG